MSVTGDFELWATFGLVLAKFNDAFAEGMDRFGKAFEIRDEFGLSEDEWEEMVDEIEELAESVGLGDDDDPESVVDLIKAMDEKPKPKGALAKMMSRVRESVGA